MVMDPSVDLVEWLFLNVPTSGQSGGQLTGYLHNGSTLSDPIIKLLAGWGSVLSKA